jgi:hypothetical protein
VNGQIVTSLQIQNRLPDFRVHGLLIDRFIHGIVFGFR